LQGYSQEVFALLDDIQALLGQSQADPKRLAQLRELITQKDPDFLRPDIAELLTESREGLARVRNIVQKLNTFADSGIEDWSLADVNECLDATIAIFAGDQNMQCEIRKQYGNLPVIRCKTAGLNQVFLGMLFNAAQAIETHGQIAIRTGCQGEQIWIEITDNGCGIAADNMPHIFESFFSTRPFGKGLGLGLSSALAIVRAHHGRIEVVCTRDRGLFSKFGCRFNKPLETKYRLLRQGLQESSPVRRADDQIGDGRQGQFTVRSTQFDGFLRHAVYHAAGFVLSNGQRAGFVQFF
jgi:two-component system NtrC family sensor kinase